MLTSWKQTFKTDNGIVLAGAMVSVYRADTSISVRVFDANDKLHDTAPQLSTDINGTVEFSIDADDYSSGQLFDIKVESHALCQVKDDINLKSIRLLQDTEGGLLFHRTFVQPTAPTGATLNDEDTWYDSDGGYAMYSYNASAETWDAVTAGYAFSMVDNNLDNITNGIHYGKVLATDISDGHILLSECSGTLDNLSNGTYSKVLTTAISAGKIVLSSAGCTGTLPTSLTIAKCTDANADQTSTHTAANISGQGALATENDLDGVPNGTTYGRVATTAISAGKIVLTSAGVSGSLPTALSDAKCTDANADQTDYTNPVIANALEENSMLTISRPIGASFSGGSNSIGVIKITLPQSWTSTAMKFVVDIFEFADELSFSLALAGYTYTTGNNWTKCAANLTGSTAANNRVRFGHDGAKCCICIGETTSDWAYLKASIRDFQAGLNSYEKDKWDDGWDISVENNLSGITFTEDISDSLIDANNTSNVGTIPASSIQGWAHSSDTTTIDGGKIYTNTVTATQINVTSLSAISANIGTITAGFITGIIITGGTIRTSSGNEKVQLSSTNNRLEIYNSSATLIGRFGGTGTGNVMNISQPNVGTTTVPVYITSAQNSNVLNIHSTNSGNTYPAIALSCNSTADMAMYINQTGGYIGLKVCANSSLWPPLYLYQSGTSHIISTNVSGCYLTKSGVWTDASSRTLKENFEDINVLDIVINLDIKRYNYIGEKRQDKTEIRKRIIDSKKREKYITAHDLPGGEGKEEDIAKYEKEELSNEESAKVEEIVTKEYAHELERKIPKHFSPMAEDFYEAFGVGDCKGISAKDLAGVALQAVKELTQEVDKLKGLSV